MANDLTVLTARDIRENVNLIQEVMRGVMKKDIHYGLIPGCTKPSLFKPGAEKIASTFRINVDCSQVDDLSNGDCVKFRVTAKAFTFAGDALGSSTGICSSDEEKYRWRAPVCDQEFEEVESDRKREKWAKGKEGKVYKKKQIRTEPADLANTILQMADKRAYVAVVRKVTAASDVFTQDIEDLPREFIQDSEGNSGNGKPDVEMPKEKNGNSMPKEEFPKNPAEAIECHSCGAVVTEKVQKYSKEKFGTVLCFDCQKTRKINA